MTTQRPSPNTGGPEDQFAEAAMLDTGRELPAASAPSQSRNSSRRKARQRSVYLFPAYGFSMALDIARQVEESGGGTLTEETLAVNLGLSKNSSGFRLKCLAARQFNLLIKQGATVTTTSIAKAILKPTSEEDALRGYRQSFLSIPLFQAVSERYRGQRLPDSQTLRNVLEREFLVEHKRVQQAERLLLDSARDTYLLKHRGDGTYLTISDTSPGVPEDAGPAGEAELAIGYLQSTTLDDGIRSAQPPPEVASTTNTIAFSLDEIGQLGEEDFERVWEAVGILVKARSARRLLAREVDIEETQ